MKKRRLPILLCLFALLCALALPVWGAPSTPVYLLAANDKFCDLPGGALPIAVNGVIYVPYSTFDRNLTGVDLGVYYGITPERGTVLTLYSLNRGNLTFTINASKCEDDQGNVMSFCAITRNGIPYVPAAAVCNFFGLQYSFLPTPDRGTAIRLTNLSSPHMDDSTFLTSARGAMTTRYEQIVQSLSPQPTSSPVPTTPPVVVSRPPVSSNKDIRIYFSLDASQLEGDLTALFPSGVYALFLFTPDSLPARAAQIRKLVAAGHSVGLIPDYSLDTQAVMEQLERGNELLSHIARFKTRIVAGSGGLNGPLQEELERAGWAVWSPGFRSAADPSTIQTLLGTRPATVRMDLTATGVSSINRVVTVLRLGGYDIQRPLETDL